MQTVISGKAAARAPALTESAISDRIVIGLGHASTRVEGEGNLLSARRKFIRASEVGEYVFCARAWRLRADGVEHGSGHGARRAGTEWHQQHGRGVVYARRMKKLAAYAALAALALAVALALLWWWG